MRPYAGERIALGTMHGKERAVGPPVTRMLDAAVLVPPRLDTDVFGTFTGEVPRSGTMLEAARAKARLAMAAAGLPLGIASEGSYGPHPHLPFVPGGTELLLLIDDVRGIEFVEALVVARTNYDSHICASGDDVEAVLARMGFPSHAATVRPLAPTDAPGLAAAPQGQARRSPQPPLFKGLTRRSDVAEAVRTCVAWSSDGKALLAPDMRAHLNPTRMAMICAAASRLARRVATPCPRCAAPGFGIAALARGLPCADCGMPTSLPVAMIDRCRACGHERHRSLRDASERATPGHCEQCNP